MNTTQTRSGAIDAVRALGIAAVISGHTWGLPLVRPLFYTWHVPLFFFLAGYFWSEHRTIGTELSRRTRTLGVPYLAWYLLIALVFVPIDVNFEPLTLHRLFAPAFDGRESALPFTTFWFVSTLFAAVILLRLLWHLPQPAIWAIAIAGVAAGVLYGPTLAQTPLSLGLALPCLIFMLVGRAARQLEPFIAQPVATACALLAASAVVVMAGWSAPVDIKQGDFGTPGLSVVVACAIPFALILLAHAAGRHTSERVHGAATFLARSGLPVVLVHPLVWWLMRTLAPDVPAWPMFGVTIVTTWCVSALVLRTRGLAWLTGGPRLRFRAAVAA